MTTTAEVPESDARITLLFHNGTVQFSVPADCAEITPEGTVAATNSLTDEGWNELKQMLFFRTWHKKIYGEPMPETHRSATLASKHIIGLLLLTVAAMREGRRPFMRFPETYLHPRQQLELADFLISITETEQEGME